MQVLIGKQITALVDDGRDRWFKNGWKRAMETQREIRSRKNEDGKQRARWKFRRIKSREYLKGIWLGFLGSGWLSWVVAKR